MTIPKQQIANLFFLLFFLQISGVFAVNEDVIRKEIENHLGSFRLDAAEESIAQLSLEGDRAFYRLHIPLYKYLASLDPVYSYEFRENWNETIHKVEDLERDIVPFYLAELNGKRAIIEFLEHNYLTAIRFAKTSYGETNAYQDAFPDRVEGLKMLGLFNILLGNVPRRYQWLAKLLGYSGDLKLGVEQLEKAAASSNILRMEAQLAICQVEKSMLDKPESALERLQEQQRITPDNELVEYQLASSLLRLKKNEEALEILNRRAFYQDQPVFFIPFWDFLLGKAYYYKNDSRNAQRYLAMFVQDYKGSLMRTDAYFRLGMALTLNQQYDLGKTFFQLIGSERHGGFDEDEYASYMAKKFAEEEPDGVTQSLFRARNYYDGGYYGKALAILRPMTYILPQESQYRTELYYRLARIFHSRGETDQAISYYQNCIEFVGKSDDKWLQAYACYFMGEIEKEKGNLEEARVHYEKALAMDGYFYQAGLENRCKAALAVL